MTLNTQHLVPTLEHDIAVRETGCPGALGGF